MTNELVRRRTELIAKATADREKIATQLERYQEITQILKTGYSLYRKVKSHKILLLAGVIGLAATRPLRLLRFAGYAWSLYKLVRSTRRLLK